MEKAQNLAICPSLDELFADAGDVLIPKKIYLFEFPEEKDIREGFVEDKYITKELTLEGNHGIFDMSFLWSNYVNRVSDPDKYTYKYYKDETGTEYLILVEAIARKKKFKDGSLPIACKLIGYNCYADVVPKLRLPKCF